jgi:TRAP-type C4-dicarboxylate transport system permease small subunit
VGSKYLALPLSLLLFLQWPLRDLVHGYSREANDLAQAIFAIYVAVAVTVATRRGTHLAADVLAHRYPPHWRARLARAAALGVLVPFALLVLYHGVGPAWSSLAQLERFPETLNPGYFVIRIAVLALAALVLAQALRHLIAPPPSS